ncbi:hypothetical protein KJ966_11580 [bacterium]|nr:hypothetical protein [bacterium]
MREEHKRLLDQVSTFATEGKLGESVKKAIHEYDQLPPGLAVFVKCVADYHENNKIAEKEVAEIRSLFFQLIIVAYRECKKVNPEIAQSLLYSLIKDYPDIPESSLITKWSSLAQACIAFREVGHLQNRLLIWQQSTKLFQAYNEFLSGLLNFLIITWRCSQNRKINTNVFSLTYGSKLNQFEQLTGGENGAFYIIFRLAQPKIRNAIAHETIWLDSSNNLVRYTDGKSEKKKYELDLIEYMAFTHMGSHLGEPYIAALGAITIWEEGSEKLKSLLPDYLKKVLSH